MSRTLACVLVVLAGACREAGTLRVDLGALPMSCQEDVTEIAAYFVRGGSCADCTCTGACPACEQGRCVQACGGEGCAVEDVRQHGIAFEPPVSGPYVAIYKYRRPAPSGGLEEVAVVCAELFVETDSTTSAVITPMQAQCCY